MITKQTGKREKARNWLLRNKLESAEMLNIERFSKTATFEEIAHRMRAGETFYAVCGGDTTERESCQYRLAQLYHTSWDYWQELHFANVRGETKREKRSKNPAA